MDSNWNNKKCRDCAFRVQDVDPNNIAFKGNSVCRESPPQLLFIPIMREEGPAVQPLGSQYPFVGEDTWACSRFESNKGEYKRNIIKSVLPPELVSRRLS